MQASAHSAIETHVKRAFSSFIDAFFKELKRRGAFAPVQQHILVVQLPYKEKKLNIPVLVHIRWLGGRNFGFLAHTIVSEDCVRELVKKILEEERKLSSEVVPRERGKLSIIWGSAGLQAVEEAIIARDKTMVSDCHMVRPESKALLAALYVLQSRKGVDAPLYIYSADKRKEVFFFYVPEKKIHTYDGEKGVLHFGTCPSVLEGLTHTRKPIVVARKAVLDV